MVNRVILVGNLGADPELRTTGTGTSVTNIRLATNSRRKQDNEWKDEVEWHSVTVWGKQAENLAKFMGKGRQIYVEGRLHTRAWEDNNGQRRQTTEVVAEVVKFIGSRNDAQPGAQSYEQPSGAVAGAPAPKEGGAMPFTEEEVPF